MRIFAFIFFGAFLFFAGRNFIFNSAEDSSSNVEEEFSEIVTKVEATPKKTSRKKIKITPPKTKVQKAISAKKIIVSKGTKYKQKDKTSFIFDSEGNAMLTSIAIQGEYAVAHGDVLIGKWEKFNQRRDRDGNLEPIKFGKPKFWPEGRIPFVIEEDLVNTQAINEAITHINEKTNLTIVARESEEDYLFFTKGEANCLSFVGMQGGRQNILLAKGCGTREIIHEVLHAIGFIHEHSREDRDDYIEVIWENIETKFHSQFHKLPLDFLGVMDTPFDFKSVMLYPPTAFSSTPGDYSIVRVNGESYEQDRSILLSEWDIERINSAYP